ncbi:group III truncated hemoglobin [Martelella lutilitoris]|uniref:Group III truncated hemoglobin n=1 Tax=Martelella lutilitoris TaxID=2583532 RepID=A0A5C4JUF2_9HYPH|nr:group III truncated hemoglobin [Martelella lutilitoris]TNB48249.1 group III truncated hemoglobin [Martelella lutilitoris]
MQQTPITAALIRTVVTEFYAKARKDAPLGPVFRRVVPDERWAAHIAKITDFWSSVFLKTGRYQGRPMPEHLAIPEISDVHFRRWLKHFGETTEEECPPETAALFREWATKIADAMRINIAMQRGKSLVELRTLTG